MTCHQQDSLLYKLTKLEPNKNNPQNQQETTKHKNTNSPHKSIPLTLVQNYLLDNSFNKFNKNP